MEFEGQWDNTLAKKSRKSSKWSYLRRQQAVAAIQARWNKRNGKCKSK